jgi:hypothetical protein
MKTHGCILKYVVSLLPSPQMRIIPEHLSCQLEKPLRCFGDQLAVSIFLALGCKIQECLKLCCVAFGLRHLAGPPIDENFCQFLGCAIVTTLNAHFTSKTPIRISVSGAREGSWIREKNPKSPFFQKIGREKRTGPNSTVPFLFNLLLADLLSNTIPAADASVLQPPGPYGTNGCNGSNRGFSPSSQPLTSFRTVTTIPQQQLSSPSDSQTAKHVRRRRADQADHRRRRPHHHHS